MNAQEVFDSYWLWETGIRFELEDGSGDWLLESAEAFQGTSIAWLDAFGNPFPAGVQITLTDVDGNVVDSGFTQAGGSANLLTQQNATYTATFVGTQGPDLPFVFTVETSPVVAQVPFYASPTLTASGYTNADPRGQLNLWPRGWLGDSAKVEGGIAYTLSMAIATALALVDAQSQAVLGKERIQSSQGADIARWAEDFLGKGTWEPGNGESDPAYVARVLLWLQSSFATLYAMETLVQAFLNLSEDPPAVQVFDWQSDPIQSAEIAAVTSFPQYQGYFVVALTYGGIGGDPVWHLDNSFLDVNTFLAEDDWFVVSPPPGVDAIIRLVEAAGCKPIYVANTSTPP